MKIDERQKEEYKIARSKERIAARNARKESRRILQGAKMLISKEEIEAREKAGKKPITPKKWKEDEKKRLLEARNSLKAKPKDFYSEELKARRKAKKKRLRAIRKKIEESFNPQSIFYPKYNSHINPHIAAQAKFDIMILHIKQSKAAAKKQSKEDKAKYKASLVASKMHVKKDNKASLAA